ncbi:hypothetical protein JCM10207_008212 [Rhodosporidiobolus poonsookiae]
MAYPPVQPMQGPPNPAPPLAQTPLLSFLVHTPNPSLVLPLSPLLDALKSRQSFSPLRTPLWTGSLSTQPSSRRTSARSDSITSQDGADPAALLGSIERLDVKTPLGVATESSVAAGGDYFSLTATAPEAPSPSVSSSSSASSATTLASESPASDTPLTAADDDDDAEDSVERMMRALKPVFRNEAWRMLEAGTRRNSAAPRQTPVRNPAAAAKRKRPSHDDDVLMGGIAPVRNDSFGTGSGGSRGGSPLGTVEEEGYEMDTDDESGLGSIADEEPWQSAYQFLTPDEQATLLGFILDCLEESDVVAGFLPRPSSTRSSPAPYHSPNSISPTSTPSIAPEIPSWRPAGLTNYSWQQGHLNRTNTYTPAHPHGSVSGASSTPNVCRIDDYVISATIVPVPPGAHPPTGFVVLSAPPPAPSVPATSWLPNRLPVRSTSSRTPSVSSSAATVAPPTAPTDIVADAVSAYKSPSAEALTKLPGLTPSFGLELVKRDDVRDPYLKALGNSEMARRIREHDWSKTAVGPISSWPRELKTMVASILASPFRECILYGESMTIIYNDLYVETAGNKHPALLGLPAREGWKEIWDGLNSVAKRTLAGETCYFKDHFLAMERHGFTEETYHTFSYAPIYSEQGEVLGILNLSIEVSPTVIAARRLSTVRDLVQMTSLARTIEDFAECALKSLSMNSYDLPFALLYTVEEVTTKPSKKEVRLGYDRSTRNTIKLTCRGSSNIPQDHPFLIQEALVDITPVMSRQSSSSASTGTGSSNATAMDLRERLEAGALSPGPALSGSPAPSTTSSASTAGANALRHGSIAGPAWAWPFEEACMKRDPVVVDDLGAFAESLDRSKGWSIAPRQAVVIPVMVEAGQTVPSAVLVLGVNAMNRYDHLMETFFNLVARHVAIGLFAVLAAEQDRLRADELVKLDRAKSNFFSSVSHELRTPLTLILGPLEDLLTGQDKDKLDKTAKDKLVLVNRHANRLLAMVNKLLDFSSIEGGRMNFKFRPVQIGPLTRDIAVLFRDAIERSKIEYVVDCDEDPSDCLPVYLSPDIWEKIVFNLVGNSLKYSQHGRISVTLRSTRGEAVLSVCDTGIGIPQAELGKIFDRFHRIEANSRMATGSGIGLALTLELVKLLGGQLEVESEVGNGSTFTVRLQRGHTHLPIEQVDHTLEDANVVPTYQNRNLAVVDEAASWRYEASIEEAMDAVPLSSGSSSASNATSSEHGNSSGSNSGSGSGEDYLGSADVLSLKNRSIVLVDDSRDLRIYMASLLSKQFTVVQFGDPREALEYINKHPPSLILTDAMMPYITGVELTAAVRRNPATALLPIIMISAQAGSEARAEALEAGLDDYICKPFQPRELVARVRVHLQLGLMRVELEKRVEERTRALIESEARNRSLAEKFSMLSTVSPTGVVEISPSGQIVYANPRWYEISGASIHRPAEEWKDTVVEEDWPKVEKLWQVATSGGEAADSESSERQFRFKNGRWAQLEIRASVEVGLPDGCFVGALTEITKQKEVELLHIREVEQRAADAEQTRINTEMFLDMSSHELRNPLSGVWQNAEVVSASLDKYVDLIDDLRDGHVPPTPELEALANEMQENVDAVESIMLCASHQQRIADDILQVSKLNMGLLTINPIACAIVPKMNEVLRVFDVECSQKGIALRLEAHPSIEEQRASWVKVDPSRLHQILLNFISNSVKYTTESTRKKRITVHIQAFPTQPPTREGALRVSQPPPVELDDAVWIAIAVEDSGRGLSDEELTRLFARFSQANPRSDQYGGSGLGLYVSKKLVELHSGFIEVESRLGVGSIFSFSVPAQRASPPSSPVVRPAVSAMAMVPTVRAKRPSSATSETAKVVGLAKRPHTSPTIESHKSPKSSRMSVSPEPPRERESRTLRVLVVEDNLVNQKVLVRQLKNAGYETQVANNGQEALDMLAEDDKANADGNPFCCALFDIEMPVMTGLEAIQELRRREKAGETSRRHPVCALTGNARDQQVQTMLELGFDDVQTKPYKFPLLLASIVQLSGHPAPSK